MKNANEIEINDDCYIFKDEDLELESNIILTCGNDKFIFNESILELIFGYGLLNCIINGVDSTYEFDYILSMKNPLAENFLNNRLGNGIFPKKSANKKKLLIILNKVYINCDEMNKVKITIHSDYGFANKATDNFKIIK